MGCGCQHIIGGKTKIRHVHGNVLRIAVPLLLRTVEVENGVIMTTDTDFSPSTEHPISIVLDKGAAQMKFVAHLRGNNIAYFEDMGSIPVGTYSLTVLCKDAQGNPYRFKESAVLQVTDTTAEAGIELGIEYQVEEYYLDNAVFFASGTADRGIAKISVNETSEQTTVTFLLTDGTTESFTVHSGLGLIDQEFNINSERAIANKVVTGFRNEVVTTLEERSSVTNETLTLRW